MKVTARVQQIHADGSNTFLNVEDCGYGGVGVWTSGTHERPDYWKTLLFRHSNGGTYMFAQFGSQLALEEWLETEAGKSWVLVMDCR